MSEFGQFCLSSVSEISLQPFSLMLSFQGNNVYVMQRILDISEYRMTCIKYCTKNQNRKLRNYWSIFWEGAITLMQVFEQFHHFKDGHTSIEGEERSGHTSSSGNFEVIVEVHNFVRSEIVWLMRGRLDQRSGHDTCVNRVFHTCWKWSKVSFTCLLP